MTEDNLMHLFELYTRENEKFEKGNKLAGTRARKALASIINFAKERRKEIQEKKNLDK